MDVQKSSQNCISFSFLSLFFVIAISLGGYLLAPSEGFAQEDVYRTSDIDVLFSSGRYVETLAPLKLMADDAKSRGDWAREAKALHDLGFAYLGLDERDQAERYLNRAARIAESAGLTALAASARNNLGTLHARQPDGYEQAKTFYREAANLAKNGSNFDLAFDATTNEARLELKLQRSSKAIPLLESAEQYLAAMPDDAGKADNVLALGRLLARAGAIEAGFRELSKAREQAQATDEPRRESLAAGYLADLYADADRASDAISLYEEASFLAQAAVAPDLMYRWQWRIGQLRAKDGDVDPAIQHYRRAITELEKLRPTLLASQTSAFDGTDLRSVYVQLADLILRRSAASLSAEAKQQDLEEARQVIERFRATELTDYFQDECVADLLARIKPIDRLESRTAVLYPIVTAERLVILLSLPDGLQQRSLPISADALTQKILDFRKLLEKRTTNEFLRPAQELYGLVLRPLEPVLSAAGVDTLVVVPDEALRTIPLGALYDGEQFVIDRYALATVPSLRLIEPKPLAQLNLQPLLAGLSEPVQGFPALPYVERELAAVEGLIGGDILSNQGFVANQLEQSLSATSHSVVHVASHAQFKGDAKGSFILTYDGRLDMDSLEQFIKLSRFRDQPVELLTLSACQTAAGDDRAALGLAGLAVKSGARSALASLWHVNDRASSLLLADFYKQLRDQPGISKARALQQAQIATKADLRYRHPAYWASLLLVGNWL